MSASTSEPTSMSAPVQAPVEPLDLGGRKVALVHDWLTGMRGGEKVLEALAALVPGAPIYTLIHTPGTISEALSAHPIHTSWLQRVPGVHRRYRSFLPLFPSAIEDFDLSGYDVVLSTSHCVAKGVVPAPDALHVCYCHSPMRYAWDQEHVYFPKRRGLAARVRNLLLSRLRTWDAASAHRVDLFVANSHFVAQRIRHYYGRASEVVAPPVDVERFASVTSGPNDGTVTYDDPQKRCLMVSALAPYKRVDVALAACRRLGLPLDVVGEGPERGRLQSLLGPHDRLLGRVDDETLQTLYARASYFLQPGVEDFGIASVEALASGTPVVARDRGGIRDIVEDGVHGVLYRPTPTRDGHQDEPHEIDALTAAIDKCGRIRFNPLKLQGRAGAFGTRTFLRRMRRIVLDRLADLEPPHDDP